MPIPIDESTRQCRSDAAGCNDYAWLKSLVAIGKSGGKGGAITIRTNRLFGSGVGNGSDRWLSIVLPGCL